MKWFHSVIQTLKGRNLSVLGFINRLYQSSAYPGPLGLVPGGQFNQSCIKVFGPAAMDLLALGLTGSVRIGYRKLPAVTLTPRAVSEKIPLLGKHYPALYFVTELPGSLRRPRKRFLSRIITLRP